MRNVVLLLLFVSGFLFAQHTNFCSISEGSIVNFSKTILGSGELQTKKTKLGYVAETESLKAIFVLQNSNYNLSKIQGSNAGVLAIWKSYFNPAYSETSTSYENTIQKKNGSDVRLQKYQNEYYIEVYSCEN